jgi:hypothetical protein
MMRGKQQPLGNRFIGILAVAVASPHALYGVEVDRNTVSPAADTQDGMDEEIAHASAAEVNTIHIYAWNELSEGGWVGTGRLDAIADVLR